MTWDCWPKNTIREHDGSSAIFPQAFSHISLVNTAYNLSRANRAGQDRQQS